MAEVSLNVVWVKQETRYFCGPAVAQMVLTTLNVASPALPPTWQTQLYAYITANTDETRPASAPDTPEAPAFPEQKCERCSGTFTCWSTTPTVLRKLLNENQATAVFAVSPRANEETATDALLDAIDVGVPGVALVHGWAHWLVVDGYRHSARGTKTTIGGRDLNGVYVRDPDAGASLHYISYTKWHDDYLSVVPCGQYINKIVVLKVT